MIEIGSSVRVLLTGEQENIAEFANISKELLAKAGHKPIRLSKPILRKIERRCCFDFETEEYSSFYGFLRAHKFAKFNIVGLSEPLEMDFAMKVSKIQTPMLIRWVDVNYEEWQNHHDITYFESKKKRWKHLPLVSNGHPYPLERTIIDTSNNPGRRILRLDYSEGIAHRMWLGPEFFERVPGADRQKVLDGEFKTRELSNGMLEVLASETHFIDESNAALQNRLRELLFPQHRTEKKW